MARRNGDHLHPSIPTLWAGPRNTPRDPATATSAAATCRQWPNGSSHRPRLVRHACDCGLADLSMRQRRGAQKRRPFALRILTIWVAPRSCHSYQCRRQSPRSAGAKVCAKQPKRARGRAAGRATPSSPHAAESPARPPEFPKLLAKNRPSLPRAAPTCSQWPNGSSHRPRDLAIGAVCA